MLRHRIVS